MLIIDLLISAEFVDTPQDTIIDEGATFVWDCTATGKPTPVLFWVKDGQPVDQLEHFIILANNSLVIRGVKSEDGGQYRCRADNGVSTRVVQATLTVRGEILFPFFSFHTATTSRKNVETLSLNKKTAFPLKSITDKTKVFPKRSARMFFSLF